MHVNKGAGVDGHKEGLSVEDSEACWVIIRRVNVLGGYCVVRFSAQQCTLSSGHKAIVVKRAAMWDCGYAGWLGNHIWLSGKSVFVSFSENINICNIC